MPLTYDDEGRLYVLPKTRKADAVIKNQGVRAKTLTELIGHSPDEADALALAVYVMLSEERVPVAGAI